MNSNAYASIGDHVQRHYKDRWELTVDDILNSLQQEKYTVERHEIVAMFQSYSKNSLGSFIVGRRGQPSRIRWKALPKNLSFDLAGPSAPTPKKSVEMLEYPLVMRPGVTAKLLLPADLSAAESARVAEFVQQLPMQTS